MTAEFPLAVHALVYLHHTQRFVSSSELADNICTNPARVRKVLARLHHAGLVEAREGRSSGYCTIPQSAGITLAQVLAVLQEQAVGISWRSGDVDRSCLVCSGMADVMDDVYAQLNRRCNDELACITIGQITDRLFAGQPAAAPAAKT